jgi:hypothetical protein
MLGTGGNPILPVMSSQAMICIALMQSSRMPFRDWNLMIPTAALLEGNIYPAIFNGVLIPDLGL